MTNPLAGKIAVRDAVQFATVLVVGLGSFFGLKGEVAETRTEMRVELSAVKHEVAGVNRRLDQLDARQWELRGNRSIVSALYAVEPVVCPADVTTVALR